MTRQGALYSLSDFKSDLWVAWLETTGTRMTGDFTSDCRSRGLFSVLNKRHYEHRTRWRESGSRYIEDRGAPHQANPLDRGSGRTGIEDVEPTTLVKRHAIRALASVSGEDMTDLSSILPSLQLARPGGEEAKECAQITIARRNWWRSLSDVRDG
jgi:hypothetical protein